MIVDNHISLLALLFSTIILDLITLSSNERSAIL